VSWTYFILCGFGVPGFLVGRVIHGDPWMGLEPGIIVIFAAFGFIAGSLIGSERGRTWQGAWLGLILGPCGWLITSRLRKRSEV